MAFGASEAVAMLSPPQPPVSAISVVSDETKRQRIERMVAEHHAFVWRSVRRFGVPMADADDVVQEVFLTVARNLDGIENERGYLMRACMYAAAHARRTIQRRREVNDDDALDAVVDRTARPDESAVASEQRARLQAILDEMPDDLRALFVMYELERFTMAEISELMDVRPGTVASRLRRARELFMTLAARSKRTGGAR